MKKEEINNFIKKRSIEKLVKGEVTDLVEVINGTNGDCVELGILGGSYYVSNCEYFEDKADGESQESDDYSYDEPFDDYWGFEEGIVKHWYLVDEDFAEFLEREGEIIVPDLCLWGCKEDAKLEDTTVIKDFLNTMKILLGEENELFDLEE